MAREWHIVRVLYLVALLFFVFAELIGAPGFWLGLLPDGAYIELIGDLMFLADVGVLLLLLLLLLPIHYFSFF